MEVFKNQHKIPAGWEAVFPLIGSLLLAQQPVTVAIDGGSTGGKSTLGRLLLHTYDCNLFSMDDFFLRPQQRTPQRLSEIGGNIDYERFYNEVISGIASNQPFRYQKYDCATQMLGDCVLVTPKKLNVVEGVYSLHPYFKKYYTAAIFLRANPHTQPEIILGRNGPQMLPRFVEEWIPMENRYFEEFDIANQCDLVIEKATDGI